MDKKHFKHGRSVVSDLNPFKAEKEIRNMQRSVTLFLVLTRTAIGALVMLILALLIRVATR
jgi:hypothetical protein